MSHLALLDACVLVPQRLSSLLLTLAEHGLYEPRWSESILEETERTLIQKLHLSPDLARRRLGSMRTDFPEAAVFGFEELMPGLQCDPKDRHVLAAAISGGVDTLVTKQREALTSGDSRASWSTSPATFAQRWTARSANRGRTPSTAAVDRDLGC